MSITDWPKLERPREKLLHQGPAALSDAELLAIFLRTGLQGKTAVDLARDLLLEYGGLRAILVAERQQLCQSRGLGDAKYALLQAALEITRRHFEEPLKRGQTLHSAAQTRHFLVTQLRDFTHEVFACLFLDQRHRIIRFEVLFHGTIDSAAVHPREIIKRALAYNAPAVIFAHNHPSGIAEPSRADLALTQRLKEAMALVDIRLLDHFVVGDGEVVSFAERGLL